MRSLSPGLCRTARSSVVTAAAPAVLSGPARAARRDRRSALAHLLVALLTAVLAVGCDGPVDDDPTATPSASQSPAASWSAGAHAIWTLEVTPSSTVVGDGDQIVVVEPDASGWSALATAYDVSGAEPVEQWSAQVGAADQVTLWGDYVVVGSDLVSRAEGAVTPAPWSLLDGASGNVFFVADLAMACASNDSCVAWSASAPLVELWSQTIPGATTHDSEYRRTESTYRGEQTITMVTPTVAVDMATGVLHDFSDHAGASFYALSDGWAVSSAESGTIALTTPSGDLVEMIERSGPPTALPVTTLDHPRPSMEELKAWVTQDDLSWAHVTSTPSLSAATSPEPLPCDIEVTVDEASFVPAFDDGTCGLGNGEGTTVVDLPWMVFEDGTVVAATWNKHVDPTSTGTQLIGMWDAATGAQVSFPGVGFNSADIVYLVDPGLVVASSGGQGTLTAYAPGPG